MDPVIYSLDDTINDFFASHAPVTRQECDEIAASLVGRPVNPVLIQGSFSYTVIAGAQQSKIVQFRDANSDLDTQILDLAQRIHGQLVAAYTFHGRVGQSSPLTIYSMEKLPGTPYVSAQSRYYFALFFAASWKARQHIAMDAADKLHTEYRRRFERLSRDLPPRYEQNLGEVREGLPLLFASKYPMVLNHGDLSEMNILVDPSTGHITGVIDWAEAKICPFGISLWGLENVLGSMNAQGWRYHLHHHALRVQFWQTFEEAVGGISDDDRKAIQIARMAGFFLQYGFAWEDGGREPVKEGTATFMYLNAFCATGS
ncbi:hypothetical protein TOPH_07899 [Tolypocladium ophioglossoides CBS 100239]|uniref:Aminoglycoside phosphotransferase domain-containing protein n=1 Tax=Tolypocladium ophioglossoides (strain CBS 100239) TaxID=1163406 RepID=A0A0L0N0B5_TOLOC|nr:hypothetical protein TOPH_07899 [Tolypocladium ophioglossoides CBS 100239]